MYEKWVLKTWNQLLNFPTIPPYALSWKIHIKENNHELHISTVEMQPHQVYMQNAFAEKHESCREDCIVEGKINIYIKKVDEHNTINKQ